MAGFNTHQETLAAKLGAAVPPFRPSSSPSSFRGLSRSLLNFPGVEEELAVPPVTVVLEGRSICHRISLHKHASYRSLAVALRQMFMDVYCDVGPSSETEVDITNAVPGHLVAYEDMEDDLLLVGDLKWKDFVRVVKRIRIIPVKAKSRKERKRM